MNKENLLKDLPDWEKKDHFLKRTFRFSDFSESFAFMTLVALSAEKMNHHPNWKNVYNTLEVSLSTHEAGNQITEKDIALARKMDEIWEKHFKKK